MCNVIHSYLASAARAEGMTTPLLRLQRQQLPFEKRGFYDPAIPLFDVLDDPGDGLRAEVLFELEAVDPLDGYVGRDCAVHEGVIHAAEDSAALDSRKYLMEMFGENLNQQILHLQH
eukprot:4221386-Pyramimonas_sp.AAC.1